MKNTICLFGDSITWGASDTEKGGWGARLQHFLVENNYDTRIYNCGICGDNSDALVKRFKIECDARNPDIIILSIGINDSQFVVSKNCIAVPVDRYIKNLAAIINCAKQKTEKIIVLGITNIDELKTIPVAWNPDKHYYKENIDLYNKKLKEFCKNNNCIFVKMNDLLTVTDLLDGVHPNSEGHRKIFLIVKSFLISKDILKKD